MQSSAFLFFCCVTSKLCDIRRYPGFWVSWLAHISVSGTRNAACVAHIKKAALNTRAAALLSSKLGEPSTREEGISAPSRR